MDLRQTTKGHLNFSVFYVLFCFVFKKKYQQSLWIAFFHCEHFHHVSLPQVFLRQRNTPVSYSSSILPSKTDRKRWKLKEEEKKKTRTANFSCFIHHLGASVWERRRFRDRRQTLGVAKSFCVFTSDMENTHELPHVEGKPGLLCKWVWHQATEQESNNGGRWGEEGRRELGWC